jgi:hypothetical protein
MGTKIFDHVTFNLGYNFQMVCTRMLIFHMSVSCDKIFSWVPKFLTMWPWPWCLTYLLKTLILAITFKRYVLGCWYFTWVFLVTRSFHGYQNVLTLWLWPWCLTLLLKTLTLAITFKWYVLGCWYFTWVFLVTRSLHGYQTFWPFDLDLDVWPSY